MLVEKSFPQNSDLINRQHDTLSPSKMDDQNTLKDKKIEILSDTTRKYSEIYGVPILRTLSKIEEQELVKNLPRGWVNVNNSAVWEISEENTWVMYTDKLFPCIAALAFCNLNNGNKLIGCAHIFPRSEEEKRPNEPIMEVFTEFFRKIKDKPSYAGEKVHIYFAGGRNDTDQSINSKMYDSYCKAIIDKKYGLDTELSGVLIDPYHINGNISKNIANFKLALKHNPKYGSVSHLCSTRAGITPDGIPFVRQHIDVSFDYDENKFPTLEALNEHCKTQLNIDLTQLAGDEFDKEM